MAPLTEDLRRDPAAPEPSRTQTQQAWRWLSRLYWSNSDMHFLEGMYAAAEWTMGLTDVPPVAAYVPDYSRPAQPRTAAFGRAGDELDLITAVIRGQHGIRGHGMDYVGGARDWLLWWVGATDLPHLLQPKEDRKTA